MTTICIPMTETIKEGQEFVTPCFSTKLKLGQEVKITRVVGTRIGKPIATGEVTALLKDDPKAPVTPTKTGKRRANVWRNYFQIKVKEIF